MASGYQKPIVALSNVPSVGELCNRLGFENASQKETNTFTEATHEFRKSYKTSDGGAGINLTNWYAIDVQQELTAMATKFVDECGNSERFWSSSRRWKEYGDITYPEDRRMILDLLKQLFWKQNKYALNNQTYGEKKYGISRDQSRDSTTPTRESTYAASVASIGTVKPAEPMQRVSFGWQAAPQNLQSRGPVISLLEEERADLIDQMQSTLPRNDRTARADIFDVPDDPPPMRNPQMIESSSHQRPKRTPKSAPRSSIKERPATKKAKTRGKVTGKISKNDKAYTPKIASTRQKAATASAPPQIQTRLKRQLVSKSRPDPNTKTKPKVHGLFWIVTSPEPNYSEQLWVIGQIKGKTLSTLVEEISDITHRDHVEKLKIKLKTTLAQTTTLINTHSEEDWVTIKHNLEDRIKEAFTKDPSQQHHFQIWIEPLYEQNVPIGVVDDVESGEIDW